MQMSNKKNEVASTVSLFDSLMTAFQRKTLKVNFI